MAQLFRITKLNDSTRCMTFTFILPPATASDDSVDILSRDFLYAGLKWRLCLQKKDRQHLSPYLQLISVSPGMQCLVDVTFVLVNRETFSQNEIFAQKQVQFDYDQQIHGHRTFVTLDDLAKRSFTDNRNEFLFEVTLKQPKTSMVSIITLCPPKSDNRTKETLDYQRYDTEPFLFGDLKWSCVFCPNMDVLENGSLRHMIQITRKTRLDSLCKLNYRVVLGGGRGGASENSSSNKFLRTEMREEIFDFNGNGEGIYFTDDYFRFSQGNQLQLNIELYSLSFINHLKLNVLASDKQPTSQCFDTDRQNWCLKMTPLDQQAGEFLTLTLNYPDNTNIPREYERYVVWNMQILPAPGNSVKGPADVLGPLEQYYSYFTPDKGVPITTKVKIEDLKLTVNPWLDKMEHKMLVQIEWLSSYLLVHPFYHAYDDVYRKQIVQMRREIQALQNENYSLEKELHSYQLSIADKCGSGGSNTPSRTASVSSNASNPSRVINGGPASLLQAKAALAAVSLLAAPGNSIFQSYNKLQPNRRSSVGLSELSPERPTVSPDRRLSVEHSFVKEPVSPTRSKSGGNIVEVALNGAVSDSDTMNAPATQKRMASVRSNKKKISSRENSPRHSPPQMAREARMRSSRESSPRHSPPQMTRDPRNRSSRENSPPVQRRPESGRYGQDRRRQTSEFHHSPTVDNRQEKSRTEARNLNLLCEPIFERGRSRSVTDFTKTQHRVYPTPVSPVYYEEPYGHPYPDEYSRRRLASPVRDYPRNGDNRDGYRYFDNQQNMMYYTYHPR